MFVHDAHLFRKHFSTNCTMVEDGGEGAPPQHSTKDAKPITITIKIRFYFERGVPRAEG